jgi:hypothetical protein
MLYLFKIQRKVTQFDMQIILLFVDSVHFNYGPVELSFEFQHKG